MNEQPHELTAEEIAAKFLSYVRDVIDFWATLPDKMPRERIEGAVFSVLAAIDGESAELPGFVLAPNPHPDDQAFHQSRGESWYPIEGVDIAGELHNQLHR